MFQRRVITNEGSVARDHLANERTFLAWVRTALGISGLGVVMEKVVGSSDFARAAGVVLITYGIAILLYALRRFDRVERALMEGRFPPAQRGPILMGALGALLSLAALAYLLR